MYLVNSGTSAIVNIRLTDKGRELLASGFKEDNVFDIVKFSFGDSEVDYRITGITGTSITEPSVAADDLKSKLYASGSVPSGTPVVNLSHSNINMTRYQGNRIVTAETVWPPVESVYLETYRWVNLGPLNDYDFILKPASNTRSATISTYDVTGSTTIKVVGQTTGKYETFLLTINN